MMTTEFLSAVTARDRLVDAYRDLAGTLLQRAQVLAETPVEMLAAGPVAYVTRSTRALEDALDEALTAL